MKTEIKCGKVYPSKKPQQIYHRKELYHGVCNHTSFSEEKQKALKPISQGKYGIFIIMGFYCTQAVQKWLIQQGQSGQITKKLLLLIICPHGPVE